MDEALLARLRELDEAHRAEHGRPISQQKAPNGSEFREPVGCDPDDGFLWAPPRQVVMTNVFPAGPVLHGPTWYERVELQPLVPADARRAGGTRAARADAVPRRPPVGQGRRSGIARPIGGAGPYALDAARNAEAVRVRGRVTESSGAYRIQAALAACHATAATATATDWSTIARLYRWLVAKVPSAVVELNRAVAVAMADGPDAGLALVAKLRAEGDLSGYYLLPATEADLLRRLGRYGGGGRALSPRTDLGCERVVCRQRRGAGVPRAPPSRGNRGVAGELRRA